MTLKNENKDDPVLEPEGAREPVIPEEAEKSSAEKQGFVPWPIAPQHASVREMLLEGEEIDLDDIDDDFQNRGGFLNFFLLLLLLGAAGGGVYQLHNVSAAEVLEAKRAAAAEKEQAALEEMLKHKKQYGVLRIETIPAKATVIKDGEAVKVMKKDESGQLIKVTGTTPLQMQDVDVNQVYRIRLELDGYEPFDFAVAKHIWTSEGGDFKFLKKVELTAEACEHWYLYDPQKKEEQKFPGKGECSKYHDEHQALGVSVTPCTCKALPEEGAEQPEQK